MSEKFRILIVDDDRLVLDLMLHAARRHEILEPEKTSDPEEALRKIRESTPFHIVLTDLSMPKISGLTVLRTARAKSPDTRGIIVTGFGDKESTREAIKLGVSDYLNKPFRIEEMDLALRKAIEHFTLRRDQMHLEASITELETRIRDTDAAIVAMETEQAALTEQVAAQQGRAEQARERARALMKAVSDKNPIGSPISRDLLEATSLVNQKQMTEEEFSAMKKSLIDRAYKSIVT